MNHDGFCSKKNIPLPQIYLWLTGEVITRNSLSPIAAGHHKLRMERGEAKKFNAIFKGAVSPDQICPIVISMDRSYYGHTGTMHAGHFNK
jgi:hypothetical protein